MPKIMIVSEYMSRAESEEGRNAPALLLGLLAQAGIAEEDCHFTYVISRPAPGGRVEDFCGPKDQAISGYRALAQGKYIRSEFAPELERLGQEVLAINPNVIIALGNLALWALCKKTGLKKYRGSPMASFPIEAREFKVLATWPMISIIRNWEMRVVALADFTKAKREAAFPELRRPARYIHLAPDLADIEDFYHRYIVPSPFLGCDIETKQRHITEVGYSTADGKRALVIPFYSRLAADGNYWGTAALEQQAWKWVRRINEEKPLVGQNFVYDMTYFWRTVGIPCPKFHGDTMVMHHALQPEMEKGLGFLGSIYTDEPSWKFMRKTNDTLKREDV